MGQPIKYFIPATIISAILFYWLQNNVCIFLNGLPYAMLVVECHVIAFVKGSWIYLYIISCLSRAERRKYNLEKRKGIDTMNRSIFKRILLIVSFESIPIGTIAFVFVRIFGYIGNSKMIFLYFCAVYFMTFVVENILIYLYSILNRRRKYKLIIRN